MKYALLNRTHAEYDAPTMRTYRDLFEGGPAFMSRVGDYLPKGDTEPPAVFKQRCARAYYTNHAARIVNFFASSLMASPPKVKAEPDPGPWYEDWYEDADGAGSSFEHLMRALFVRALVARRAFVRVEFPTASLVPAGAAVADADRLGARVPRVVGVPTENITHWRRNEDGSFRWVVEHTLTTELSDFAAEKATVTETWTQWMADGSARRWQSTRDDGKTPKAEDDVLEVEPPANPTGACPLVELCLPPELWVMAHVSGPALEHFRKENALAWAIDRTCYAMPWFYLKNPKKPPTMGTGYYGILGLDEKVDWPAPPVAPFQIVRDDLSDLVQAIHRVAEQMALGMDQRQGAVAGRAAASKQQDQSATETVLRAYGAALRNPTERVLDLVSLGRGETTDWDVGGMDLYDLADADALTTMAVAAESLRVPSATYRRELYKAVTRAQLTHLDEETRAKIDKEIDAGITDEEVQRQPETDPNAPPEQQVPA